MSRDSLAAPQFRIATEREREDGFSWSGYRCVLAGAYESTDDWASHHIEHAPLNEQQWTDLEAGAHLVLEALNDWPSGAGEALLRHAARQAKHFYQVDIDDPIKSKQRALISRGLRDANGVTSLGRAVQRARERMLER